MENSPAIILFWYSAIIFIILTFVLIAASILLLKRGNQQHAVGMRFLGKVFLILSVLCSVPIILLVGYIVYLYIG